MRMAASRPARLLLIIGPLSALGSLCIDMYLPALPTISRDLHAGTSATQASLTTCLAGLALGQVLVGPVSDRLGRRRPLLFGVAAFVVAAAGCAVAPDIYVFLAFRFVQGLGGASGIVISRAIVRDRYAGPAAARFFSMLMTVVGTGPLLAPQLGAALLALGSWRTLFAALALAGLALMAFAYVCLPETLPAASRAVGAAGTTPHAMRSVITDRAFLVNALACGIGFGAIFSYVAGAPFALENTFGLSPALFGIAFGVNGAGLILASHVNGRLVGRLGPMRLFTYGAIGLATGSVALLAVLATHAVGLFGVLACMFVVLSSNGFIAPNAMALALNDFPHAAGSASALLGVLQFSIGAAAAPLIGVAGPHNDLPMGIAMACFGVSALIVRALLARRPAPRPGLSPPGPPPPGGVTTGPVPRLQAGEDVKSGA
jgi:DHA1 family bicyclomycin/chloramphenicol resistance-like MFS transporter